MMIQFRFQPDRSIALPCEIKKKYIYIMQIVISTKHGHQSEIS